MSHVAPQGQAASQLNQYLRHATFGLSKVEKEEVWSELEEHILTRAEQLQVLGFTSEQAYQQVLQELGWPFAISAKLNKVHNMPKLIVLGVALLFIGSLGVYAWSKQPERQKVNIQTELQVKCVAGQESSQSNSIYDICDRSKNYIQQIDHFVVNLNTLKPLLENKKLMIGDIKEQDGAFKAYTPKHSGKTTGYTDYEAPIYHGVDRNKYVNARFLIDMNTEDMQIRGFERIFVTSKVTNIEIPIKKQDVAWDLYNNYTLRLSGKLFERHGKFNPKPGESVSTGFESGKGEKSIEVQTSYQKDQIVALFTMSNQKMPPKNQEEILTVQHHMAKVDENGIAKFKTAASKYHFVRKVKDLKLMTETKIPTALLIKVSGIPLNRSHRGIFTPQQSKVAR